MEELRRRLREVDACLAELRRCEAGQARRTLDDVVRALNDQRRALRRALARGEALCE